MILTASGNTAPCNLAAGSLDEREEWIRQLSQAASLREEVVAPVVEQQGWNEVDPGLATTGLSPDLKTKIDSVLEKYTPHLLADNSSSSNWKLLFENRNGVTSHELTDDGGRTMMKSVAILPHHPKQLFKLMADSKRREQYETNIQYSKRLERLNGHTFIDYYAYQPVWPTSAREFLVVFHWRIVRSARNRRAILLLGYSHDAQRPVARNHVRAHLELSLTLLEEHTTNGGVTTTRATRFLSYDLCGNIPQSLSNTIMQQQATLLYIMSLHLQTTASEEPANPRLSRGPLTNDVLRKDIVERLTDSNDELDSVRRRLQFSADEHSRDLEEERAADGDTTDLKTEPSCLLIAIILLTPLVIYNLMDEQPGRELIFLVTAYAAIRTTMLLQLGTQLVQQQYHIGPVSCKVDVSLKEILLAKRRREETTEVSGVIPLLIKAIGTALSEMDVMNCRQVSIPLLSLKGSFLRESVDVSVMAEQTIETIEGVDVLSVEQVAAVVGSANSTKRFGLLAGFAASKDDYGSCLVVPTLDSGHDDVQVQISPSQKLSFNAVIVVDGVRSAKQFHSATTPTRASSKPYLSLSITVDNPACTIADCKLFAERIQELLEDPVEDDGSS